MKEHIKFGGFFLAIISVVAIQLCSIDNSLREIAHSLAVLASPP